MNIDRITATPVICSFALPPSERSGREIPYIQQTLWCDAQEHSSLSLEKQDTTGKLISYQVPYHHTIREDGMERSCLEPLCS